MVVLNLTAELDETWNEDGGMLTQQVVIKMNNREVARFEPDGFVHSIDRESDLAYEAARWFGGRHRDA